MKKTVYFTSVKTGVAQLQKAIEDAVAKREKYLLENKTSIAKIDNEDIKFVIGDQSSSTVFAVIQLTYYPEEA